MRTIQLLLLCSLAAGCTAPTSQDLEASLLLKQVSAEGGIDHKEAELIAKAYFLRNVGCGFYESVSDGGGSWVVHGKSGVAGKPIEGFFIAKDSGSIHSTVGPSYESFSVMLK